MITPIASGRERIIEEMTKLLKTADWKQAIFSYSRFKIVAIIEPVYHQPKNYVKFDSHPDGFRPL
jgi:tRNA nucleotidyltransferase/poly(A) polymerase